MKELEKLKTLAEGVEPTSVAREDHEEDTVAGEEGWLFYLRF